LKNFGWETKLFLIASAQQEIACICLCGKKHGAETRVSDLSQNSKSNADKTTSRANDFGKPA
jgi:hypothetical protein